MKRRSFLLGLAGVLAAPAVIRTPGLLMPVRSVPEVPLFNSEEVRAYLASVMARGGIYDYHVVCDDRNNTVDHVERGELVVDVMIRPMRTPGLIAQRPRTMADLKQLEPYFAAS